MKKEYGNVSCAVVCDGNMDMFPIFLSHFFELLVLFFFTSARLHGMREMDGSVHFTRFTTYACIVGGGSRCDTIFSCR